MLLAYLDPGIFYINCYYKVMYFPLPGFLVPGPAFPCSILRIFEDARTGAAALVGVDADVADPSFDKLDIIFFARFLLVLSLDFLPLQHSSS
jgi:hypothetical protein